MTETSLRARTGGGARSGAALGRKPGTITPHMALDDIRKGIFLAELRRHGIVVAAARAASPHATDSAASSFYNLRRMDPEFAAAWADALQEACGSVEMEIHRRAVEGWEEPVYQKGELVGTVTKYSDRLLELRARGLMPERYAVERRDVKVSGEVQHQHQHMAAILTIKAEDVLLLPPAEREQLMGLLGQIAEARGETLEMEHGDVQCVPA